jgi:hypothetical protein
MWALLFEQDLLKTMLPISIDDLEKTYIPSKFFFKNISFEFIYGFYWNKMVNAIKRFMDEGDPDVIAGEMSLDFISPFLTAIHRIRSDKPCPELFISDPSDTRTEHLAGFLVHSLFQYKVLQLQALNAEQILEIRGYLKDTKEGFTYYINQMTDDVEQRMKSGNFSEMEASQKTIERKILPLYEEFRRQLAAKKTGYWANVLSASAEFLKVDAAPWTPKFYGEVLKWLGVALNLTAKDEEALLTNQNQAFQYLATLERYHP